MGLTESVRIGPVSDADEDITISGSAPLNYFDRWNPELEAARDPKEKRKSRKRGRETGNALPTMGIAISRRRSTGAGGPAATK